MKKIRQTFLFVMMVIFLFSPLLQAQETKDLNKTTLRESMVLLGLYLYGVNREVEKKIPDYDALEFLSDSILRTGKSMKAIQGDNRFQTNLDNMILQAENLNKFSTKNHRRVRAQAEALGQSCAACHAMGSDPYTLPKDQK